MTNAEMLIDAYNRIHSIAHRAVSELSENELAMQIEDGTNSIAWLDWHLSRVQDDHIAAAMGDEQIWAGPGWHDRSGLPFDAAATGRGHGPEEIAALGAVAGRFIVEYHDAVHTRSLRYLSNLTDHELERIVDESWDPPVSLGVRLVSVLSDNLQHAGQALFVRGVLERR